MKPSRQRLTGIALTAAGSVLWSTGGLFARVIPFDIITTLMWRSIFAALSLAMIVLVRDGRRSLQTVRSLGWAGTMAIPVSAVAMLAYVAALKLTTVANVMIVYATLPFVAAGIAFVWMRERPTRRVLLASGIAFLGVAILAGFSSRAGDLAGDAMTLLMTVTFGVLLVMARRYQGMDMAPLNAFAAALCALVCFPFAAHGLPDAASLLAVAGFGIVCTGLAFLLFLTGSRYIPSSEAGLIGFVDVILAPIWMWLAFGERPSRAAVVGGVFVIASVVWYLLSQLRADRGLANSLVASAGESLGKAGVPSGARVEARSEIA